MSRSVHHLAKLNTWDEDAPVQQGQPAEEDLSVFSNTHFYDMDIGRSTDIATTVDELLMQQEKQLQYPGKDRYAGGGAARNYSNNAFPGSGPSEGPGAAAGAQGPLQNGTLDFHDMQEFSLATELPVFNYYPDHGRNGNNGEFNPGLQALQNQTLYDPQPQPAAAQHHQSVPPTPHPTASDARTVRRQLKQEPTTGSREHSEGPAGPSNGSSNADSGDDADSRHSVRQQAEEDKRRRNTAASARFRIKKKIKEQEMERNTRQMQGRIDELQKKMRQLEMENRWLKTLVVERNDARDVKDLEELRMRLLGENGESK